MQYAKFGRTGLEVSRLALGTATFGKQCDEETSRRILDKAADAGVNFLDTAGSYPMDEGYDFAGRTEEILGRWLKGKRGQFFIGTKAGGLAGPSQWDRGSSRKHILDAIDASLTRMGIDYVDLFSLHMDDPATPWEESLEALDIIVRSGKARYVGVSNFLAYRLARAIGVQNLNGLARFACVQPRYNLLFREIERELIPLAEEENLAVTPYNPLAGGLLTNKYAADETPDDGRFSDANGRFGSVYRERYWHEREFDAIRRLAALAAAQGMALPSMAVGWMLAKPRVTSVILGASKPEQLDATLDAANLTLSADLVSELDQCTAEFRRGDATR